MNKPDARPFVVYLMTPDGAGAIARDLRAVKRTTGAVLAARGSAALVGVALSTRARSDSMGEELSYLVVGTQAAADPGLAKAADALLAELQAKFTAAGKHGGLGALDSFLRARSSTPTERDKLTLMLYRWMLETAPPYFLDGTDMIHEAFVAHLHCRAMGIALQPFDAVAGAIEDAGPTFSSANLVRMRVTTMFASTFEKRMNRVADASLQSHNLPGMRAGQDIALAWFLLIAGLLSGATEVALIAALVDIAVNYLQFIHEMELAERDGEVSEAEVTGVLWSLVFVGFPLLPFGAEFLVTKGAKKSAGAIQAGLTTFQVAMLLGLFVAFVRGALEAARAALEYHEHLLAARSAGFGEYTEFDMDRTIVVPLAALAPRPAP